MHPLSSRTSRSFYAIIGVLLVFITVGMFAYLNQAIQQTPVTYSARPTLVQIASTCALMGDELWLNKTFPFQKYAAESQILRLPEVQTWLTQHSFSATDLKPYVSLYSSCSNPYDYSQGDVTENGTSYRVFSYVLPSGEVLGAWVSGSPPYSVPKLYTYDPQHALKT